MNKKILLFLFIALSPARVLALTDSDLSLQRQQIIDRQQEQQRQFEKNRQQLRETQRIRKTREAEGLVDSLDDGGIGDIEDAANCYKFNKIKLLGNKEYSTRYLNKKIVSKYIGKCINRNNMKTLQSELTKLYIEGGYTATRIYFDLNNSKINECNAEDNVFIIVIEEGKIGEINFIEILPEKKNKNKKDAEKDKDKNDKDKNDAKSNKITEKNINAETEINANQQIVKQQIVEQQIVKQDKNINSQTKIILPIPPVPSLPVKYLYVLASPEEITKKNYQQNYQAEKDKRVKQLAELKQIEKERQSKLSFWEWRKQSRLKRQTFFAFPLKANRDKVFNIRDFEQGLDQINRLQSSNAAMQLNPSLYTVKSLERIEKKNSNNSDINSHQIINPDLIGTPQAGYSDIAITNDKHNSSRTTFLSAGVDNSGSQSTGEILGNVSISQDNLFAMNDNIFIKYTQNIDGDGKLKDDNNYNPSYNNYGSGNDKNNRYNKSFYSNISIPLGYWTFSNSLSYSKYLTTINGYYSSFESRGNTFTQNYSIDRIMHITKLYRMNLGTNLEIRDTESYIRDVRSETGSRKSSNINLFINNTIYTKLGTIIIKPSYQRGLDWFGSKEDENHSTMLKTEPRLQYNLLKLYAYYNTRVNLPLLTKTQIIDPNTNQPAVQQVPERDSKGNIVIGADNNPKFQIEKDKDGNELKDKDNNPRIKQEPIKVRNKINLNYTLTADSQYSFDTLYGTNQFSVGGEYTTRGFRNSNISGDNGYYIRNDLRMNLQQLFPRYLLQTKSMNYGNKIKDKQYNLSINDALSRTYIGIFYDYGYVKAKHKDSSHEQYNSESGYMSGVGLSLNYYGNYLNWSLTYAKALQSPNYLQTRDNIKKEEDSVYWRVGVRW